MLYLNEDEESLRGGAETGEPNSFRSPRSTSSSLKLIPSIADDSGAVIDLRGVVHSSTLRPQNGESRVLVSTPSSVACPLNFFLGMSGGSDPSKNCRFTGEGDGSGEANGEGRGVSWGDFGTLGNRASLSANFPPPCTEVLRGNSKIFPSSTQKSQGQSLSLPLAVGFHELAVLWPEMVVPDCAYCNFAVEANEALV